MKSWLFPAPRPRPARAAEASPQQLLATGAAPGAVGLRDPLDGDTGYRPAGSTGRPVPEWTQERARAHSVAAYRSNPMARAIVDTYTSFCVGDSGVTWKSPDPKVNEVVGEFAADPRVRLADLQELLLRDLILNGELLIELMRGQLSGVVRICPVDTAWVQDVTLERGNPLWPDEVIFRPTGAEDQRLRVVRTDDSTGLRTGEAMWWAPWRTLLSDRRGMPFLTPVLDWLDSYDQVLSNLIDRTALARYLVWDVTIEGEQTDVDAYVEARGGLHVPPSGSVEVHTDGVKWEAKQAQSGAVEDAISAKNVLTMVAGGAGLAKTWLAEPEDANRATSLSMAEPVRRRVQGVQKMWLGYDTELLRYVVDQAVAAGRLPATVTGRDARTNAEYTLPAAQTVTVAGPEVAAADAQITAQVLLNLSTGLQHMVQAGVLSQPAARVAARKAWEDYMGVPYTADLDGEDTDPDDLATHIDDQPTPPADPTQPDQPDPAAGRGGSGGTDPRRILRPA